MKNIVTLLIVVCISATGFAQNEINFKALIKDAIGNVVSNQSINLKFKIQYDDLEFGIISLYEESQTITTDQNGITNAKIGGGNATSGNFETINWLYAQLLNVEIDIEQDGSYVDLGLEDIHLVPKAHYAEKAGNIGLNAINEGNGTGHRITTRNPLNYANIGFNAVDLSYSSSNGNVKGASGNNSTAMGISTTASGFSSTALGNSTKALGQGSTAMGGATTASALYSTAFGFGSTASATESVAMGFQTQATGRGSVAMGYESIASGDQSIAIGRNAITFGSQSLAVGDHTIAFGRRSSAFGNRTSTRSFAETVVGTYNTDYVPNSTSSWSSNDRIFVVGIGSSSSLTKNAMTVLKNGNVGIGSDNPQELLHLNGTLRIGDETIRDAGNNALRINAALLPDIDNTNVLGNPSQRWTTVYATNGTINTSDRREKKNINNLHYGLAEVLQMQPVSFNWKSKNNPDLKLGLIAQDLQDLIPEVVQSHAWERDEVSGELAKKELERLGVYYSDLVPVLIKAIQEQNSIIKNQGDALKTSHKNYEAVLSRIEKLESHTSN